VSASKDLLDRIPLLKLVIHPRRWISLMREYLPHLFPRVTATGEGKAKSNIHDCAAREPANDEQSEKEKPKSGPVRLRDQRSSWVHAEPGRNGTRYGIPDWAANGKCEKKRQEQKSLVPCLQPVPRALRAI
jgi:hypothetical protein